MKNQIKVIAFDADDTLWVNELYFHQAEEKFYDLMKDFKCKKTLSKTLFDIEMKNLHLYGYGIKGFILSMIETIGIFYPQNISSELVGKILIMGQELMEKPIELLDDVEDILKTLQKNYRLIIATKGNLLDQQRKLKKSGLEDYFHHIEIMSDKKNNDYIKLLNRLNCEPNHFLMLGNSIKSDILPVLEIGGFAAHIPYHLTWAYESFEQEVKHKKLVQLKYIKDIINFL